MTARAVFRFVIEVFFHVALTQNTICRGLKIDRRRHNQSARKGAVGSRERKRKGAVEVGSASVRQGGRQGIEQKISKKSHSTEYESFSPLPIFINGTEICVILIH